MKFELNKSDVSPYLWLQNEIERVLYAETLRRAIASGILEAETEFLWRESVDAEWGEITVTHTVTSSKPGKWKGDDVRHETYTLAEALKLCMNDKKEGT